MKYIIYTVLTLAVGSCFQARAYDLSCLHALKTEKGEILIEMSGYDIAIVQMEGQISDSETVSVFKKKHEITNILAEYSERRLNIPNHIIEEEAVLKGTTSFMTNSTHYLFQQSKDSILLFSFNTLNQRDNIFETYFVESYLKGEIEPYISDNMSCNELDFAGKSIVLDDGCRWQRPHSLSCGYDRISWSEFPSIEDAILDIDNRILAHSYYESEIPEDEYMDIQLDGVPTIALRVVYLFDNQIAPLIVYYAAQEIRGHFISCVMTQAGDTDDDYQPSPLLKKFFTIPVEVDFGEEDDEEIDYELVDEYEADADVSQYWEVGLGSVIPLYNMTKIFTTAPIVCINADFPVRMSESFGIGLKIGPTIGNRPFKFGDNDNVKTNLYCLIDAHYSFVGIRFSRKFYLKQYFGFGFSYLQNDLVKKEYEDGSNDYYGTGALDWEVGTKLYYKNFNVFFEYHYATFSRSSRVSNSFGNSYLNFGFTYSFPWDM